MRFWLLSAVIVCGTLAGCGTTRWSDTPRTATEQMLVTDAIDRAVSALDLRALAGKRVYLDTTYLRNVVDNDYLVSCFRQHALASGCVIKAKPDDAEYVVEIRAGAVGTDRHDVLFGIPASQVPVSTGAAMPQAFPEIPVVKKTDQRAVAKIALFAYDRLTGQPVWQSGATPLTSTAKDIWIFGAGPFQRGSIYAGTQFAGDKLNIPLMVNPANHDANGVGAVSVTSEAYFSQSEKAAEVARRDPPPSAGSESGALRAASALTPAGVTPAAVPPAAAAPSATPSPSGAAPHATVSPPGSTPPGAGYASTLPAAPAAAPAATTSVRSEGSGFAVSGPEAPQAAPPPGQTVPAISWPTSLLPTLDRTR
jgi:hypothetical protein